MIRQYTIYGERCSGTNYLEELMKTNFDLPLTWEFDYKHFFGNYLFQGNRQEDETLFIGIIRDPIEWIDSFYAKPHHVPLQNRSMPGFLLNEFYSIKLGNKLRRSDLHIYEKRKYKNLFEMRRVKNDFLIHEIPYKVKHYLLISYEWIRDNPESFLAEIQEKYNLPMKQTSFRRVTYYKHDKRIPYRRKQVDLSPKTINIINQHIDKEQELLLGYEMES